jgi:hypothetical protein
MSITFHKPKKPLIIALTSILLLTTLLSITTHLQLNAQAVDPKVELNTYIDPIKDLGIKPLLVTIKFDEEKSTDIVNNLISETPDIEVKELKKKSQPLKKLKQGNKKENKKESSTQKAATENNTSPDEVILGASNILEVEKIAKKANKKIKNIKTDTDIDISTKPNKDIEVMDLTPLINDLYPSKQSIDAINQEILAEAKFQREQLKKMGHMYDIPHAVQELKKVVFDGVTVQADQNTSNEKSSLIIYSRINQGLTFDVPNANFVRGQQLQLWDRWTNFNRSQNFYTYENSSKISPPIAPNLCLERYGNNYNNGTPVALWDCNDSEAQEWRTYPDGTIRPLRNDRKCIDAQGSVAKGSKIMIHDCHNGDNQNFRMGQNEDFGTDKTYEMSIHAAAMTPDRFMEFVKTRNFGHAFVSVSRNYTLTNTFGSNGSNEGAKDKNSKGAYTDGRSNNMHTWNTLNIDGDVEDWDAAMGRRKGYNRRTVKIPKSTYDVIKYMRGWDFDSSFREYRLSGKHCGAYAKYFWNRYAQYSSNKNRIAYNMDDTLTTPALLANSIGVMDMLYNTGY